MSDVLVGVVAVLAGLVLCFRGYWTLRLVLSLWGALTGFGVGTGLVAWINNESYLATALGWIVGLILAVIFAALAYLYYAIGVILSLASMGVALGVAATVAVGVTWNWVAVLVGLVCGLLVAVLAIAADVPLFLLVIISAFGGATITVLGVMLLSGAVDTADFDSKQVTHQIEGHWLWTLGFAVLAVAGILTQLTHARGLASARNNWHGTAAGGATSHRAG